MKILFLSDVYFPRINGVSTSIQTFRHNLHLLGHTVHLIAPDYQSVSADERDIVRIPSSTIPFDPEDRLMSFRAVMKQVERLRAENYDLIHVQTPFVAHYLGTRLARELGIPCVETYHTFFEEYLYHYIPLVPKPVMRCLAQRFSRHQGNSLHGMIVPTQPMQKVLCDYGIVTRSEVISTGIEAASFAPGDRAWFRDKYHIAPDRPMLLFVGRVAHEKNIGFLLKMLVQVRQVIPEILLLITGEGPAQNSLVQASIELGLRDNVQFIGYLDRETELNSCYCAADIFVFSSRTETQGLVLLEAMAQGTAVVSTAELGTLEVLREGEGVWIAAEDETEFAAKVIQLMGDPAARAQLGAAGRDYAHTWSAAQQAERMVAFYDEVLRAATVADDALVLS